MKKLRTIIIGIYNNIAMIWRPVLVDEGAVMPKGYGLSHWHPYSYNSLHLNPVTMAWQKIAFPIPVNLLVSLYYRLRYYVMWGWACPPEMITHKIFQVYTECPDCGRSMYKQFGNCSERQKRALMMAKLIKEYYSPEEIKDLIGD